jgi:cysteine desulfurase
MGKRTAGTRSGHREVRGAPDAVTRRRRARGVGVTFAAMSDHGSYLDAASTEPLHPAAREVLLSAIDDGWADPARLYREGRQARMLLDRAREMVAEHIGARPDETSFTASGTAAVHAGVLGALRAGRRRGSRVVLSAVEHSAVFEAARFGSSGDGDVRSVGVDGLGRVDADGFATAATQPGTALACLQSANHEVGTRQPVAEVAAALATAAREVGERPVPLLVDAAQSVGRDRVPGGWQLLTASAHKWGGPAGVGVLAVRRGTRFEPAAPTDSRALGGLAGVEVGMPNLPGILAAAAALAARAAERDELATRDRAWTDELRARFASLPDSQVVGDPDDRLPHLMTVSFFGVDGETLVTELDRAGLSVSSGSSCTSSTLEPSHVLVAMGVLTHGNVRVSLHRGSTRADVDRLVAVLPAVVARVRAEHDAVMGRTGPVDRVLDCRGMPCPAPVIELAKAIRDIPVGEELSVDADDPAAPGDVAAFARMRGHTFVGSVIQPDGAARVTVRRVV